MKDLSFGKVRVWFDAKQPCFVLVCGFGFFRGMLCRNLEFL